MSLAQFLNESKLAVLFSVCICLFGILYAVLTPPFQGPDEHTHFLRAYQISEGKLLGDVVSGKGAGGNLPRGVVEVMAKFNALPFHPERKISTSELKSELEKSVRLDDGGVSDRIFANFQNTVLYSPIVYLPQVIGCKIGTLLGMSVLQTFYFARLLGVLFSSTLIYFAFRQLVFSPRLLWISFVIVMMPMFLFEMSMISADGVTYSLSLFSAALVFSLSNKWDDWIFKGLLGLCVCLALAKSIYCLIPFALVPNLFRNFRDTKSRFLRVTALVGACLIPTLIWSHFIKSSYLPLRTDIRPDLQIKYVVQNPFQVLKLIVSNLFSNFSAYRDCCIGVLGWLDTYIGKRFYLAYASLFLIILFFGYKESPHGQLRNRAIDFIWNQSLVLSSVMAISLAIYLSSNAVGANQLEGLQGRYFIPILPIALFSVPNFFILSRKTYRRLILFIALGCIVASIRSLHVLVHRYWT